MLPDGLSLAILPGFPKPPTTGPHYEALLAYVREHGLPRPVLVDRQGVAWAGRTLVNICCDLGCTVVTALVEDGEAAALQELATRDLTVLEEADLVLAVYDGGSTKFVLDENGKRSRAVSRWFQTVLGKEHGFSPSQVEQYVRVGRCTGELRQQLFAARTLHQAMRMIRQASRPAAEPPTAEHNPDIPSPAEELTLESMAQFMDSMGRVDRWSTGGLELLASLHAEIGRVLRSNRKTCSSSPTTKGLPCSTTT